MAAPRGGGERRWAAWKRTGGRNQYDKRGHIAPQRIPYIRVQHDLKPHSTRAQTDFDCELPASGLVIMVSQQKLNIWRTNIARAKDRGSPSVEVEFIGGERYAKKSAASKNRHSQARRSRVAHHDCSAPPLSNGESTCGAPATSDVGRNFPLEIRDIRAGARQSRVAHANERSKVMAGTAAIPTEARRWRVADSSDDPMWYGSAGQEMLSQ